MSPRSRGVTVFNRLATGIAALAILAACGGDGAPSTTAPVPTLPVTTTVVTPPTTTDPTTGSCPFAGMSVGSVSGLPASVTAMRAAIVAAAQQCDYEQLGALASEGELDFTFSFGDDSDPREFWSSMAGGDHRALETLLDILGMSAGQKQTQFVTDVYTPIYVWPAVFGDAPTAQDWAEIEALYTPAEIAEMKDFGGYIGWRTGFTEDGEWVFFVAGD